MSKHTIGPWALIQESRGFIVTARDHCYDVAIVRDIGNEDNLANAHLIAAAPDLLEALRLAVRQNVHDMLLTGEELRQCEAAIAKAEGQ